MTSIAPAADNGHRDLNSYAGNRSRRKRIGDESRRYSSTRNQGQDWSREKQSKIGHVNISANSAVLNAFRGFQVELDSRNDCFERIVKLSRDITIESKRLIFLLHRATGALNRNEILTEATAKLLELRVSKFFQLAQELQGQDQFQFLRAFSPGLQEYIEAVTFFHYLSDSQLVSLDSIQRELTFDLSISADTQPSERLSPDEPVKHRKCEEEEDCEINNEGDKPGRHEGQDAMKSESNGKMEGTECQAAADSGTAEVLGQTMSVPVPQTEYMLGVADFTGELMKMAISSVGAGDLDTPNVVAGMMREIYDAFASFGNIPREFRYKMKVLRQSLQKVEAACYAMKVRGSEIPTHMLADVFATASSGMADMFIDEAEDFYD